MTATTFYARPAWCSIEGFDEEGKEIGWVINGGYEARFHAGEVFISGRHAGPGPILWRGVVPKPFSSHYTDAIAWIEGQLAADKEVSA